MPYPSMPDCETCRYERYCTCFTEEDMKELNRELMKCLHCSQTAAECQCDNNGNPP